MFYTYIQNNSGGSFVKSDTFGVGSYVIIEADNAEKAEEKLELIGSNVDGFDNYCPCCGQRWPTDWVDDDDGTEKPEIYGDDAETENCFIHYKDGHFKRNYSQSKEILAVPLIGTTAKLI